MQERAERALAGSGPNRGSLDPAARGRPSRPSAPGLESPAGDWAATARQAPGILAAVAFDGDRRAEESVPAQDAPRQGPAAHPEWPEAPVRWTYLADTPSCRPGRQAGRRTLPGAIDSPGPRWVSGPDIGMAVQERLARRGDPLGSRSRPGPCLPRSRHRWLPARQALERQDPSRRTRRWPAATGGPERVGLRPPRLPVKTAKAPGRPGAFER